MTFYCRTFQSGNAWPCDFEFSADPVSVVAASFAFAVVGLGLIALIYLLAKGRAA